MTLTEIHARVWELAKPFSASSAALRLPLVELTGGEPLLQHNALRLMKWACDEGLVVLVETSGAHDISPVDSRVRRVMDLKCPSSGEMGQNRMENIACLRNTDEVKFVISTQEDYRWAKSAIAQHNLAAVCPVLFSWAYPLAPEQRVSSLKEVPANHTPISLPQLAEQIIADALPVRFQLPLHKYIWSPAARGV
jgi:7-carboxy-7-deazaguanine synthase